MSRSLSYKNVSKRRFNCMKSTMRARVHDFARKKIPYYRLAGTIKSQAAVH